MLVQQTYNWIKDKINKGQYKNNGQLPSENILADELNVSRATVRTALARLEYDGVIKRIHGKGTFVREKSINLATSLQEKWDFIPMLEQNGRTVRIDLLSINQRPAGTHDAELLNIGENTEIVEIIRLYNADDKPVIYSRNIFPRNLLKKKTDPVLMNYNCTAYDLFLHYFQEQAENSLTDLLPILPNEEIASRLQISSQTPVFLFKDFFITPKEHIILAGENYMHDKMIRLRFLGNPV